VSAAEAERMSEQAKIDLVLLPGVSTAEQVSHLSGRGVGMDVVQSAIGRLGGRVQISTTPGRGTTVVLTIPATGTAK
jgi:two-component system chemotaxis sensor kinase CheA